MPLLSAQQGQPEMRRTNKNKYLLDDVCNAKVSHAARTGEVSRWWNLIDYQKEVNIKAENIQ